MIRGTQRRHVFAAVLVTAFIALRAPFAEADSSSIFVAESSRASITPSGRFIAFASSRNEILPGCDGNGSNVYIKDLQTDELRRASVSSSGECIPNGYDSFQSPVASDDGRFVVFLSNASNLVDGDTNDFVDVFRHDFATGKTIRVNVSTAEEQANETTNHWEGSVSMTPDGRFVAFSSHATNLAPRWDSAVWQIYVRDTTFGTTKVVRGAGGPDGSPPARIDPSISEDGRYVAFAHEGAPRIYVSDVVSDTVRTVDVSSSGVHANARSMHPSISADGRYVAFASDASNLVPDDYNGVRDIFVRDLHAGTTTRVSVNSSGVQGTNTSEEPSVSPDGRYVTFNSYAHNLVDDDRNGTWDVFVRDMDQGVTGRVSIRPDGTESPGATFVSGGQTPSSISGIESALFVGTSEVSPGDWRAEVFLRRGFDLALPDPTPDPTPTSTPTPTPTPSPEHSPPDTVLTSAPQTYSGPSATFAFRGIAESDDALHFECLIDSDAWRPCASPWTHGGLNEGTHHFFVRAVDEQESSDPSPAHHMWSVDATPPESRFVEDSPSFFYNVPGLERSLLGWSGDALAGVSSVAVAFHPMLVSEQDVASQATLKCSEPERTGCHWTVRPPLLPGIYEVTAQGVDRVGNLESPGPQPIVIVVV